MSIFKPLRPLLPLSVLALAASACSSTGGNTLFDGTAIETGCETSAAGPRYGKRPVPVARKIECEPAVAAEQSAGLAGGMPLSR